MTIREFLWSSRVDFVVDSRAGEKSTNRCKMIDAEVDSCRRGFLLQLWHKTKELLTLFTGLRTLILLHASLICRAVVDSRFATATEKKSRNGEIKNRQIEASFFLCRAELDE